MKLCAMIKSTNLSHSSSCYQLICDESDVIIIFSIPVYHARQCRQDAKCLAVELILHFSCSCLPMYRTKNEEAAISYSSSGTKPQNDLAQTLKFAT